MSKINTAIANIDRAICDNISQFDPTDRGLLSQNILAQLRNLVEHTALRALSGPMDMEVNYENLTAGIAFIKTQGNLSFLNKFHRLLQISASHYTLDGGNSERLMLKYYEYLLRIKGYLRSEHNLTILSNIEDFPVDLDPSLREYHLKITEKIDDLKQNGSKKAFSDRYYIHKVKPFFVNQRVLYEVTFHNANDRSSKFDRVIAFTSIDISYNYAARLTLINDSIDILGKKMPIKIISHWSVSIRPCEINNFARILDEQINMQVTNVEYRELTDYLTRSHTTLVDLIDSPSEHYMQVRNRATKTAKNVRIFAALDKARALSLDNKPGSNMIRYLLLRLNNKILKQQYQNEACSLLSGLNLAFGCIPFDQMPFNTSLLNHNPRISDLFECIDPSGREHELLARSIKNNVEHRGLLYTPIDELKNFDDIDELVGTYNKRLYYKHTHRRLETYKKYMYIKGYEDDTRSIINKLVDLSTTGLNGYTSSVDAWLSESAYTIDSPEKKEALRRLFSNSKVALVYGAAGTGKSTMINHISNYFHDKEKLYLANTNPAIDNLVRKVSAPNCTFKTIAKQLSSANDDDTEYDVLFIDECSTVSNSDLLKVLERVKFKLLVLVGDVYQIESIMFGNWFSVTKFFIPEPSIFELIQPFRANNDQLLDLWGRVRNIDEDILEHITKHDYSAVLNETVFQQSENDEIILCLNYDGLYGINNVNKFLQSSNPSSPVDWGVATYKVGDPILFNELDRFKPVIYNNLKGKIADIVLYEDAIQFDIELDKAITEFDVQGLELEWVGNSEDNKSIIRFVVYKHKSTDEDDESVNTIVPFQIAYAVSIHKAQGLEYSSVKIVITDEVEEAVTHNIFYTAITRAKDNLKIYWTPEVEKKILGSLEHKINKRDVALLSAKYGLTPSTRP
jgi:DNA replication protein DnaC